MKRVLLALALIVVVLAAITLERTATFRSSVIAASTTTINAKDRKSTRLNSSHSQISYAVFCLKKKKTSNITIMTASITSLVSNDYASWSWTRSVVPVV